MHETSDIWKQILSEHGHQKQHKITINGNEYGESRIIRVSVKGDLFDAPGVGNAFSRTMEATVMPLPGVNGNIPPLSEIKLFTRLASADGLRVSEYVQKGVFYADTVKKDSDTGAVTITAFDAMMKAEKQFGDAVCRITFDDGYGGIQRFIREIGDAMPTPDTPSNQKYNFQGWTPNPNDYPTVVRDMRFIAQWAPIISGEWWTLYKDGTLDIYIVGDMPDYSGLSWSRVPPWYNNKLSITRVTLQDGVTHIGNDAFLNCLNLTSVTIPDSVTSIGDGVFSSCQNLSGVTIPDSVISIGGSAFYDCKSLTSVTIPDSVTSIGYDAFSYCTGLTSVTIPDSVTSIGDYAFHRANLTSVAIPASVTNIGKRAFYECSAISIFDVDIENGNYASIDGILFDKSLQTIIAVPPKKRGGIYEIPDSVTHIEDCAFWHSGFTGVTIPDSVTSIGYGAFCGSAIASVTIPASVTSIGNSAFEKCTSLRQAIILSDIISKWMFSGCSHLWDVSISGNVSVIASYAFSSCAIRSIVIPDGVVSIEDSAFSRCNTRVLTIPVSVISIEGGNFYYYDSPAYTMTVYYAGNEEQWNAIAVNSRNNALLDATIHYNSSGPT